MGAYSGAIVVVGANFRFGTGAFEADDKVTTASNLAGDAQGQAPESLLTPVEFSSSQSTRGCVVTMRHDTDVCAVCLGDPMDEDNELTG